MDSKSKIKIVLMFLMFVLFLGGVPLQAQAQVCPCFNPFYLHSVFTINNNAYCEIYRQGRVITLIHITDGKEDAYSTMGKCGFNADYHHVSREYSPLSDVHISCISAVMEACVRLKLNVRSLSI